MRLSRSPAPVSLTYISSAISLTPEAHPSQSSNTFPPAPNTPSPAPSSPRAQQVNYISARPAWTLKTDEIKRNSAGNASRQISRPHGQHHQTPSKNSGSLPPLLPINLIPQPRRLPQDLLGIPHPHRPRHPRDGRLHLPNVLHIPPKPRLLAPQRVQRPRAPVLQPAQPGPHAPPDLGAPRRRAALRDVGRRRRDAGEDRAEGGQAVGGCSCAVVGGGFKVFEVGCCGLSFRQGGGDAGGRDAVYGGRGGGG